jgi:hypothetical protein
MLERLSPATRTVLRAACGIAIAIVGGFGTFILAFLGGVTATGCFIECSEPNVVGGSLLLAGAIMCASVTVAAVVWGAIGWQRRVLGRVAGTVAALASAFVAVVIWLG